MDELVCGAPLTVRLPYAMEIRRTMRRLVQLEHYPSELIPDEVLALADASLRECCRAESQRAFWNWLIDLARRNETDRVARVSALNTAASRFDSRTAAFVRAGLSLNNQRVVIGRKGDQLTLSYAEREWGRVRVRFEGCRFPEDFPDYYIPGYAFSTEAEVTDDGLGFHILVDTRFSDNDYCQRLMQPFGWHDLGFSCRTLSLEITACDYAGRLSRLGTPRAELIDRVCASLISKHSILGSDGLSADELSMLPAAQLITGCGGILTAPKDQRWLSEQKVLDALDNRYAMNRLAQLLEDCKCTELSKRFDECRSARYEDDDNAAVRNSRLYAGCYELHIADGRARPLIMELSDRLCAMTAPFSDSTSRIDAENSIFTKLRGSLEPQLTALNFEGTYPHYSRTGRRRTEYLSVMLLPASEVSRRGIHSYYVSLSAAHLDHKADKLLSASGLDLSRANALDCQPELNSVSRYGELASADDGIMLRVDADTFRSGRRLNDDSSQLGRYVCLADRQFRRGRLPVGYSMQRLFRSTQPSSFLRILLSSLPLCAAFSLALLVAYLVLTEPLALPGLTPLQAFGGASALCVLLTLLTSFARRIGHAFTLWRYR
ncbi:MAG: hypothetical protein E7554_08780 [Ruminococcaceae bacterium]|nr:hypothetical protein [Oscillospiraceae bacterium]